MPISAISSPLQALEQRIVAAFADIEAWLRAEHAQTPPPFYCSTDLRNNGHKIAPVDTNLFPGGFNNLSPANAPLAAEAIRRQIDHLCPGAKSLLLIPEDHTRNQPYLDNIAALRRLLELAGIQVRLGRLDGSAAQLAASDGTVLPMHPVQKTAGKLHCDGVTPCAALLNNDLSSGIPPILRDTATPLLPPPDLGWARRTKSRHFAHYTRVAEQFAALLNTDPWLLSADFHVCREVDFHKRAGMECLAAAIDETLRQIQEKYRQHGINDTPYAALKADSGTYGMGVMMVGAADAIFTLNRRQRNRMSAGKGGAKIHNVLIQEGIATVDYFAAAAAEPVVYMMGGTTVGGFYRINTDRGHSDNLNSSGMSFSPLPFETDCAPPMQNDHTAARLYVYSVIGRLAGIAAAREIAELTPQ